jgi:Protein of unknown function (DUF4013)
MTDPSSSSAAARPEKMYVVAGEVRQEFGLLALRDRIRSGLLQRDDQIAVAGTELWKPAWQYPPLERYFSLAEAAAKKDMPASAVPAGPMGPRIIRGLAYPFTNVVAIAFIAITGLMGPMTLVAAVLSLVSMGYALAIIRKSAEGEVRAPNIAAIGGAGEWILSLLRVIAITIISSWPLLAVPVLSEFLGFRSLVLVLIALVVMLLYYPACLASIAMWKSVSMALSPRRIFAFISALGLDYFVAVAVALLAMVVIAVVTMVARLAIPPLVVRAINGAAGVWFGFYASHLLGWALYRHRDELGIV